MAMDSIFRELIVTLEVQIARLSELSDEVQRLRRTVEILQRDREIRARRIDAIDVRLTRIENSIRDVERCVHEFCLQARYQ